MCLNIHTDVSWRQKIQTRSSSWSTEAQCPWRARKSQCKFGFYPEKMQERRKQSKMITESWTVAGRRPRLGSGYPLTHSKASNCYLRIQNFASSVSIIPSFSPRYIFHYSLFNFSSAFDSLQGLIYYLKFGFRCGWYALHVS